MHATERENLILLTLTERGFITFRELEKHIPVSAATIRRDLERLDMQGKLERVRGGAKLLDAEHGNDGQKKVRLFGATFEENISLNHEQKRSIGKAAAELCEPNEGIMIDGGSTTLQMCPYLGGKSLQVLSNSLHIVMALLNQPNTRILMSGGAVFPEQNIILPMFGEDLTPSFHSPKLFMGAASIGAQGLMQEDAILVASERRFIERADEVIVLADASKFRTPSGYVVCQLEAIATIITDQRISDAMAQMIERAGPRLIVVE